MDKKQLEIENMLVSMEDSLEKADYMARSLISHYNLDEDAPADRDEALCFAKDRQDIGSGVYIILDYIRSINSSLEDVRKAVGV